MESLLISQQGFIEKLHSSGKSFNTIKNYRTDLKCFNDFLLARKRSLELNELTETQVTEYARYIDHKYDSANSRRRRIQALRIFFDYLIGTGSFHNNPIKKMISSPKVVDIPRPIEYRYIEKLYKKLHETEYGNEGMGKLLGLRNMLLLQFIYGAGLKVSDIAILKTYHISQGADGIYRVLVAHPKRDPYTIPLDIGFNEIFDEYLLLLSKQKNLDGLDFEDVLFNSNPFKILSGGLSPRGIELIFEEFSLKADFKMTPRALRQSCIFKWLNHGIQEAMVKEWMGVRPVYSLAPFNELLNESEKNREFIPLILK